MRALTPVARSTTRRLGAGVLAAFLVLGLAWSPGLPGPSLAATSGTAVAGPAAADPPRFDTIPPLPVAVSGGGFHTCARMSDETARCWGANVFGELGDGSTVYSALPVTVSGLSGVSAISAGAVHTCALLTNQTIKCWGRNQHGQLGNGSTTDSSTPVLVSGINDAIAVSAGGDHTCAIRTGDAVFCWGKNASSELGNDSTANSSTPVGPIFSNASAIAAGQKGTCAVSLGTEVDCWGDVGFKSTTPTTRLTTSGVSALSVGADHGCALRTDGTVTCWGLNDVGQLGNGTTGSTPATAQVHNLTEVGAISAGWYHTCAVTSGGTRCWGDNESGQLGDGSTVDRFVPVGVGILAPAHRTSAPSRTPAAPTRSGRRTNAAPGGPGRATRRPALAASPVSAGARGDRPETGAADISSAAPSFTPRDTTHEATQISAGGFNTCAVIADQTLRCWGDDTYGQLGDATNGFSTKPVHPYGLASASAVDAGGYHTCAILSGGAGTCWGSNPDGELGNGTFVDSATPVSVSGLNATSLGLGFYHSCDRQSGGGLKCWGYNGLGALGDGTFTTRPTPVSVGGISTATMVRGGGLSTCALLTSGQVRCWGSNAFGQLGNGTTSDSRTPVTVSGISSATSVSAGWAFACAVITGGTVRCWGANANGQLGNGSIDDSHVPVAVTGITTAIGVSAGDSHACAVLSGGTVKCWGWNDGGQLGNGTTTESHVPVAVTGLTGVTAVAAGGVHTCARLGNGSVKCWGANFSGQLGDGTEVDSSVPVTVTALSSASQIAVGWDHSCARLASGAVSCWGDDYYGNLGDGTTGFIPFPVPVRGLAGPTAGATYVALTPTRLLDTRPGGTGLSGKFVSGTPRTFHVAGRGGVPANAIAVTGNLTVVGQTGAGFVSLGPVATANPTTSTINFPVGDVRANGVTVTLGGGMLSAVYKSGTAGAKTDLLFDVTGYYVPGATGATYVALSPARLLDTRVGNGLSGPFVSGTPRTFPVTGRGGVPAGAVAVTGNLTVVGQTKAGFVALGPVAQANPTTSTINFPVGDVRANGVTVALGGGGTLSATFKSSIAGATTALLFDVTGYYVPGDAGATYVALTPVRLLDTRVANGISGKFVPGAPRTFQVTGRDAVPADAVAVTGNLTVVGQTQAGFVSLGPIATSNPTTSTINFPAGDVRANGVTMSLPGRGRLAAVSAGAKTDLLFDATGYFIK
jgi:alpha-tubulin suppressor-like RCC1 family protein